MRKYIKHKLIDNIRKKLAKKRMHEYIKKVQFLMVNGEKVDISSMVQQFVAKQERYLRLMTDEIRDGSMFTPLMFAVTKENVELVIEELGKCDIDDQDCYGYTALMYACRFNRDGNIVRLLLENRANIDIKSYNGKSALSFANDNGDREIVYLIKNAIKKELYIYEESEDLKLLKKPFAKF